MGWSSIEPRRSPSSRRGDRRRRLQTSSRRPQPGCTSRLVDRSGIPSVRQPSNEFLASAVQDRVWIDHVRHQLTGSIEEVFVCSGLRWG